jgi:hypothetical protein
MVHGKKEEFATILIEIGNRRCVAKVLWLPGKYSRRSTEGYRERAQTGGESTEDRTEVDPFWFRFRILFIFL